MWLVSRQFHFLALRPARPPRRRHAPAAGQTEIGATAAPATCLFARQVIFVCLGAGAACRWRRVLREGRNENKSKQPSQPVAIKRVRLARRASDWRRVCANRFRPIPSRARNAATRQLNSREETNLDFRRPKVQSEFSRSLGVESEIRRAPAATRRRTRWRRRAAELRAVGGSKSEPPSRPAADWSRQRPHFAQDTQRNVSVELGKTAYLTCTVLELGDKTVSSRRPATRRRRRRLCFARDEQSICKLVVPSAGESVCSQRSAKAKRIAHFAAPAKFVELIPSTRIIVGAVSAQNAKLAKETAKSLLFRCARK